MSNWFDDKNEQEKKTQEPLITPPPAGIEASGTPEESAQPADPGPARQDAVGREASAPDTGWQRSDSAGYSYTPPASSTAADSPAQPASPDSSAGSPTQQTPPASSWGNPYTPPAQQTSYTGSNTQMPGGYTPQGGYNPYSWHTPPHGTAPQGSSPTPPDGKPPKKKRNKSNIVIALLAVVCGATIITLSVLLALSMNGGGSTLPTTSSSTSSEPQGDPNAPTLDITSKEPDDGGLSAKAIVNMNLDSTVVITMYTKSQGNIFGFGGDSGTTLVETGGASGIILSADGYIITNYHCVYDEDTGVAFDRIDVTTYDGTVYEGAQIIGADSDTDLAVIKVNAANLNVAEFGDSSKLAIGDRVVTLGNAGGLAWSASQGIVSGLARDVYEDTGYAIQCLQTDAAINPGNSGGPLLNDAGQVVGINSAKIAAEGYEGLGFSIPISEAKPIIDDLMQYGYVRGRVMLGITGQQVDQPGYEGFMIRSIESGSVLENTSAQVGDIITHVDGVRVETYTEMRSELTKHAVGDTITLTLMRVDSRTGQTVSFDVTCQLGESQGQ